MRHEAAAGHAAEGYARVSGKVGVAIGTSGPGATNLVTAIADAQMDSTPTLFITGQVKTTLRGTNAFQEADVIGITQPIVKHSIAIERADDIAQACEVAGRVALNWPSRVRNSWRLVPRLSEFTFRPGSVSAVEPSPLISSVSATRALNGPRLW